MVKATVKGMLTPEQMVAARLMPGRGVALVRPNGQNVDFPNPGGKRLDEFGLYIAPNGARYGYFPHQKLYAGPTMDGFLRTTWRQQTIPRAGRGETEEVSVYLRADEISIASACFVRSAWCRNRLRLSGKLGSGNTEEGEGM